MEYHKINKPNGTTAEYSVFETTGGATEIHTIIHASAGRSFAEQTNAVHQTLADIKEKTSIPIKQARYFISDSANQEQYIAALSPLSCPFSIVQQPPMGEGKIALWIWMSGESKNYKHLRTAGQTATEGSSYLQTHELLSKYSELLEKKGMEMKNNTLRTWFFVRDVDVNYQGVVNGRKEFFSLCGLTQDTHYITSTGIQGATAEAKAKVMLDTYAVENLEEGQIKYLYAPTHLNPTYEYGVTFERGVRVVYGDRSQVMISGTASIDNRGEVLYEGNVEKQTERMIENVEVLLKEAEMTLSDINHAIVYLRDSADFSQVKAILKERIPLAPMIITLAPVCRPTWLIEMECMATKKEDNPAYKPL